MLSSAIVLCLGGILEQGLVEVVERPPGAWVAEGIQERRDFAMASGPVAGHMLMEGEDERQTPEVVVVAPLILVLVVVRWPGLLGLAHIDWTEVGRSEERCTETVHVG